MPRQSRIFIPGLSLHVIQRGHNGAAIFVDDDDCETFLALARSALVGSGVRIHGFALMKTHHHMLVTPGEAKSLPTGMRSLGVRYVRYFNRKHQRRGTLFNERYRGLHIEDESYWLNCLRYIEQNPVRAGVVPSADGYQWSSYRAHGGSDPIDWLAPHYIYTNLESTDEERRRKWQKLCGQPLTDGELLQQRLGTDPGRSQVRPGSVPNRLKSVRVGSGSGIDLLTL